jgi:hypothetical protein
MMTIKKPELYKKILDAYLEKKIKFVSYWSYPLYTHGADHVAIDSDTKVWNTGLQPHHENSEVSNMVDLLLNQGGKMKGLPRDNKTGVKCEVDGVMEPVYFVSFDGMRIITTGVNTRNGTKEYPIIQS